MLSNRRANKIFQGWNKTIEIKPLDLPWSILTSLYFYTNNYFYSNHHRDIAKPNRVFTDKRDSIRVARFRWSVCIIFRRKVKSYGGTSFSQVYNITPVSLSFRHSSIEPLSWSHNAQFVLGRAELAGGSETVRPSALTRSRIDSLPR